jgi:hypothetical protein
VVCAELVDKSGAGGARRPGELWRWRKVGSLIIIMEWPLYLLQVCPLSSLEGIGALRLPPPHPPKKRGAAASSIISKLISCSRGCSSPILPAHGTPPPGSLPPFAAPCKGKRLCSLAIFYQASEALAILTLTMHNCCWALQPSQLLETFFIIDAPPHYPLHVAPNLDSEKLAVRAQMAVSPLDDRSPALCR